MWVCRGLLREWGGCLAGDSGVGIRGRRKLDRSWVSPPPLPRPPPPQNGQRAEGKQDRGDAVAERSDALDDVGFGARSDVDPEGRRRTALQNEAQRSRLLPKNACVKHRSDDPIVVGIEQRARFRTIGEALERLYGDSGIRERRRTNDVEMRGIELEAGRARGAKVFAPPRQGFPGRSDDADSLANTGGFAVEHRKHRVTACRRLRRQFLRNAADGGIQLRLGCCDLAPDALHFTLEVPETRTLNSRSIPETIT